MPTLVIGVQGKQVAHVTAGVFHTICITTDGSVFTWGEGSDGKLGLGEEVDNLLVPTLVRGVPQNKAVVQVAASDEHSICVADDGSVYTWGSNSHGQLGIRKVRADGYSAGHTMPGLLLS